MPLDKYKVTIMCCLVHTLASLVQIHFVVYNHCKAKSMSLRDNFHLLIMPIY